MRSSTSYLLAIVFAIAGIGQAAAQSEPLAGSAAFGDWRADKPGVTRLIKPADLPRPKVTPLQVLDRLRAHLGDLQEGGKTGRGA